MIFVEKVKILFIISSIHNYLTPIFHILDCQTCFTLFRKGDCTPTKSVHQIKQDIYEFQLQMEKQQTTIKEVPVVFEPITPVPSAPATPKVESRSRFDWGAGPTTPRTPKTSSKGGECKSEGKSRFDWSNRPLLRKFSSARKQMLQ